ncbi:MAG: VanW family protein [Candidatus Gracilibacteria bacterium]|jgi:vancomycin resistance protein YoaR
MNFKKKIIITTVVAATIAITVSASLYIMSQKYGGMVYPGTYIAGIEIGSELKESAFATVEEALNNFLAKPVVIIANGNVSEFAPADLGISFDYEKTKELIPVIGEYYGLIKTIKLLNGKDNIEPVVLVDEEKLHSTLSILSVESKAQNAYLSLDTATNEVSIIPENSGQEIDWEIFLQDINDKFAALNEDQITLTVNKLDPTVSSSDLEPFKDQAKDILTRSVEIYYGSESWTFSATENSNLMSFGTEDLLDFPASGITNPIEIIWPDEESVDNSDFVSTELRVVIDETGLDEYVMQLINAEVETPAQEVSITMDDAGVITFEGSASDGTGVDKKALKEMLELALSNGIQEIDLPIKTTKGGVKVSQNLADMGVNDLIAVGYTDFSGSPYNRNLNIGVGLSKFNGMLVEPGETFSFIENLGAVDAASGYYKELVITNNETKPEYGGGLCQVSSTMYRAILYGGLPVVARTEHSYAVSYYAYPSGYGLDATIYQPSPDLKFLNDTGSYILIQAYSEDTSAYFKFYGTDDGRTVIMDGPYYSNRVGAPADVITYTTALAPGETQKKDSAHNGFDATWYRTIISGDGTETKETIFSHYQAWSAKYLVGIAEEGSGSGTAAE